MRRPLRQLSPGEVLADEDLGERILLLMMSLSDHGKKRKRLLRPTDVVLGIDLSSTKLAIVARIGDDVVASTKVKFKTLGQLKTAIFDLLSKLESMPGALKHAFIEEALVARGGSRVTIQQAYAMGAARLILEEDGWIVSLVHVSTWKKRVVGNGRADKLAISEWHRSVAPALYEEFAGDQDLVDADCIGRYGADVARAARTLDAAGNVSWDGPPLLLVSGRRGQTEERAGKSRANRKSKGAV